MAAPLATDSLVSDAAAKPVSRRMGALAGFASSALCAVAVWTVLADTPLARACSAVAFIVFLVFAHGHFGVRERMLQVLATLATVGAVWKYQAGALEPIINDLSRAAYLGAFIMLVTSLRQGAFDSNSVLSIGRYLTSQPPGRRYVALHVGGHFMGVLLNFGAVSLLGPLIKRGVESKEQDGPPALTEIRLRRQINALSRGFSWFNVWAPTTIAQAVVLTIVPGSRAGIIAVSGLAIASLLLLAGWAEDRMIGHRARMRLVRQGIEIGRTAAPEFPWPDLMRFFAVAAGLLGLAVLISKVSGIALVSAIMVAALPVTVVWMAEQELIRGSRSLARLRGRISSLFRTTIPAGSPEAATLGLAGYVGILTSTLVDRAWLAANLSLVNPSPAIVYLTVSALIPLVSCIGLPPMMSVTFLGGLLVSLPELQLDPSVLGLSFLVGWALNLTGSPFGATSLLLSRVVGIPGTVHAWRWNGLFTLVSWCTAALVILTVANWLS
jgi:hypothetical protein